MLTKPPVLFMAVPNLSWRLEAYFHVPGFQFVYRKVKHKSSLSAPTPLTQLRHLREEEPLFLYSWVLAWNELLFKKIFIKLCYTNMTQSYLNIIVAKSRACKETHARTHKYHDFPWCYRKTENKCQARKLTGELFFFLLPFLWQRFFYN